MNKFSPLVSVITLTYNHEEYIRDTILSIVNQKSDFSIEYIICNDKSTDNTDETIQKINQELGSLKNVKVKYKNNKLNKGVVDNFIWAIKEARGKYIGVCAGDDYWTDPYKLQKQIDFLESNSDYGLSFTDCSVLHEAGNTIKKSKKKLFNCRSLSKQELFNKIIIGELKITAPTVVFRKSLLKKHNFEENKFMMEDMPLWLDFAMHSKFYYCQYDTTIYRIRKGSISHSENILNRYKFKDNAWEMKLYYSKKYSNDIQYWVINQLNKHRIEMKAMFPKENIELTTPKFNHRVLFLIINLVPIKKYLLFRFFRKAGLL